ncbi:MAG: GNAT family N-acetyltransferase [Soonwooa sp.]
MKKQLVVVLLNFTITALLMLKRMFVLESERGQGFSYQLLKRSETWAKYLDFQNLNLPTGVNQPEAIALCKKCGYQVIENYEQYQGVGTS